MTRVKECVLYRGFEYGDILDKMTALMDASEKSAVNASEMEEEFYECVNGLIEIAGSYGFTGNLWHDYLTLLLVNHENAFSTASEIRGAIEGSINQLALHDFAIFKDKRPAAQLADAQTQYFSNAKDNAQHQLRALGFRLTLTAHPAEQHGQPRGGRPPGPAVQRKILVQHDQRRKPAGHGVKVEARCLVLHTDQQIRAGGLPVRHRNDGGQCYRA